MTTTRVPADVDLNDKILYGLNARQVGLLAPVALGLLGAWHLLDELVPVAVLAGAAAVIAGAAVTLVLGRRDGTSLDRLVWAAIRHPRRVLTPGGAGAATVRSGSSRRATVAGLRGPVRAATAQGLDLGPQRVAVGVDAVGVNFALRSHEEQSMLVAGFARVVHQIPGSWQVVVSTRPATMDAHARHVRANTRRLPGGALRTAARSYAAWLEELVDTHHLVRREVTVVVTAAGFGEATRTAAGVADALAGLGVRARVLGGDELAARVRSYVDPYTPTPGGTP